ncbi:MAG: UTP--glucose-1-phosphate uridylyltransferase [Gammaproteobacteria bacterium]|nr:UTP--glucose-1-phosphate uridylyltransferase [Gammaproteobacteria bacterium]
MTVRKAIFCVAGAGTRFLPATKAQPKEMLPLVDKPMVQYFVEEAADAGIKEIIFVTGRGKDAIENHFDKSLELERLLSERKRDEHLASLRKIHDLANFAYVRQPVQKGDGHALLCAEHFIDRDESVLVVFPDYLMPRENNTFKKMIAAYERTNATITALDEVPQNVVDQYGVVKFSETDHVDELAIEEFIEKPTVEQAPSNFINTGYFIITSDFIRLLKLHRPAEQGGEIRVADVMTKWCHAGKPILGIRPVKPGYDCGSKIGFLKATVDIALSRDDLRDDLLEFLQSHVELMQEKPAA